MPGSLKMRRRDRGAVVKITREWLESKNACAEVVGPFLARWPDGAELTRALLSEPEVAPHVEWLAGRLLKAPAWRAYDEAADQAWLAYEEAKAPAWRAYEEAKADALWTAVKRWADGIEVQP